MSTVQSAESCGRTLARHVRFYFDPPLRSSLGQPEPNMVYMRHPEVEGTSGATTREALDQVWRDKGWEEAPPPVVEDALADVRLLSEGLPSLAPGKTIPLVFDSIFSRDGKDYPDAYRVKVTYEGLGGRPYEEEILLDLGVYRNIQCIDTQGLNDIYKQVKRIADAVKSWTGAGRLKVLSRSDEGHGRRLAG